MSAAAVEGVRSGAALYVLAVVAAALGWLARSVARTRRGARPSWWVYRRGLRRLRHGYCPACYSSPPREGCPVCGGDDHYGNHGNQWRPGITEDRRAWWHARWELLCGRAEWLP